MIVTGWDWDSDEVQLLFEKTFTKKQQSRLLEKILMYVSHLAGDFETVQNSVYLRLKVPPDRIIFYIGVESHKMWIIGIERRSKRTYRKR